MPSGTGKTVSLLSLIVSYMQVRNLTWVLVEPYSRLLALPDQTKTHLLLANGAGDRESFGGIEAVDGVQGGDGSQRRGFQGARTDIAAESLSPSGSE